MQLRFWSFGALYTLCICMTRLPLSLSQSHSQRSTLVD